MTRARKTDRASNGTSRQSPSRKRDRGNTARARAPAVGEDEERKVEEPEEDLPKDKAGRRKVKRQYEELLGIRIEKLKGRILNRERINKTIEGVYFICASCKRVCHNIDDGLVEDPHNVNNLCSACTSAKEPRGGKGGKAAAA